MNKHKKILITGSEGFIGKELSKKLSREGNEVICVDVHNGYDLKDKNVVNKLPEVDIVIHLAAYNGTKWFYKKPYDVCLDNLLPTIFLLERYKDSVELFIFTGTCESYAGALNISNDFLPTDENVPLVVEDIKNPRWSYGGSKISNEINVIAAHEQFDMNYQILRLHNIYGPTQKDHFFPEFIERAKKNDFTLFGHENSRCFLYIDDAIEYMYDLTFNKDAVNSIINIGSNAEISIYDAAKLILKKMGINDSLICKDAPKGSISRRVPCLKKLEEFCGKRKITTLEKGIEKYLKEI